MPKCHELKMNDTYVCQECSLELQVVRECDCGESDRECACHTESNSCFFVCCGKEMKKKV